MERSRPEYPFCEIDLGFGGKQHADLDRHAKDLDAFEQTYHQISAGRYTGLTRKLDLGAGCSILIEFFNQTLDQWGCTVPGKFCVIFFFNESGHSKLGGREFDSSTIILCPPNGDYDLRSATGSAFCALAFPTRYVADALKVEFPEASPLQTTGLPTTLVDKPVTVKVLRQIVNQVLATVALPPGEEREQLLTAFRLSLATISVGLIHDHLKPLDFGSQESGSVLLATAVRDAMRAQSEKTLSIGDLANSHGVSRRTIETSFRSVFGQSPALYQRVILLNRFRSALLAPANRKRSIGDIASEFGIWHLSRLAQQYRRQFHEFPSDRGRYE